MPSLEVTHVPALLLRNELNCMCCKNYLAITFVETLNALMLRWQYEQSHCPVTVMLRLRAPTHPCLALQMREGGPEPTLVSRKRRQKTGADAVAGDDASCTTSIVYFVLLLRYRRKVGAQRHVVPSISRALINRNGKLQPSP